MVEMSCYTRVMYTWVMYTRVTNYTSHEWYVLSLYASWTMSHEPCERVWWRCHVTHESRTHESRMICAISIWDMNYMSHERYTRVWWGYVTHESRTIRVTNHMRYFYMSQELYESGIIWESMVEIGSCCKWVSNYMSHGWSVLSIWVMKYMKHELYGRVLWRWGHVTHESRTVWGTSDMRYPHESRNIWVMNHIGEYVWAVVMWNTRMRHVTQMNESGLMCVCVHAWCTEHVAGVCVGDLFATQYLFAICSFTLFVGDLFANKVGDLLHRWFEGRTPTHVPAMDKSCRTWEWVLPHMRMRRVSYVCVYMHDILHTCMEVVIVM